MNLVDIHPIYSHCDAIGGCLSPCRSLGILTYVLLTGHTPFGGDTKQDTYCNITLGELDFPQDLFEDVSAEAIHFITQLVVKNSKSVSIEQKRLIRLNKTNNTLQSFPTTLQLFWRRLYIRIMGVR